MPATPSDIAKYTTDGVLLTSPTNTATSTAIKATHPNAIDPGAQEIEMFYNDPNDAQAMLDEAFTILSQINPPYFAVEIDDTLGLGSTIPFTPNVPSIIITDAPAGFAQIMRVRAYAQQAATDRYAVELIK